MVLAPYCGWTKSCTTWKPWLKPFGNQIMPGSLGGAKWFLSTHSTLF